ncbi:eukaryotic translation initiation factor 2 subunit 2 [Caerostris extrusa]|uniref:Eukaryotic translation initiation factor 2 subunit 2 n=1 Tax=Caerostris extrusa TaxID=172846 RepID=A0AAV4XWV6_CAEEX|nr:eukaryotic translation initiation factor 2 subunit 2 [Caerostris extrusa]
MEENSKTNDQDFPLELKDFVGLKKKKKVRFSAVGIDSLNISNKENDTIPTNNTAEPETTNKLSDLEDDLNFQQLKKKKKKKKIPEEFITSTKENDIMPAEDIAEPEILNKLSDIEDDLSFQQLKKKKKKKKSAEELSSPVINTASSTIEICDILPASPKDDDTDYTYEELLARVFNIMREKDPNIDNVSKKKLVMKPPQIIRIGTKKSSFVNFIEICKLLHRTPQHLQSYLLVELGTSGSVDGNNQLIIKGRFEQRQIENVLRRYIKEYVTCHTCHSPDTMLQKDTRIFFLQCESCGSRCSVASIKSGFQAVTSKRAAIRAKSS